VIRRLADDASVASIAHRGATGGRYGEPDSSKRAGKRGTSAEAEHRRILAEALRKPRKKTFAEVLAKMPNVGRDSDFERVQD
jgi:hypothetical protein